MAEETVLLNFEVANAPSVESSRKKLIELKEEQNALTKAYRDGLVSIDAYTKALAANETATAKERQELNLLKKTVDAEKGSVNDLIATNKRLVDERNNLSDSTEAGKKRIDEINRSLDANTKKLNLNISESERQKQGYNTLISILDKINPGTEQLVTNLGTVTKGFTSSLGAVNQYGFSLKALGSVPILQTFTAITGVITALNEAYKSTLPTIEDYRKANAELTKEYNKQNEALTLIEASVSRRVALLNAEGREQDANKVAREGAAERLIVEQLRANQLNDELVNLNKQLKAVSDQYDRFGNNRNADEQKVIKDAIKQVTTELTTQREIVANVLNEYNILQEQSARLQNQQKKEFDAAAEARKKELEDLRKKREELRQIRLAQLRADVTERGAGNTPLSDIRVPLNNPEVNSADFLAKARLKIEQDKQKALNDAADSGAQYRALVAEQEVQTAISFAQAASTVAGIAGEQSAAYKAFASASTIISTYSAATKAYEAAFLPVPTVASPALGAGFAAVAVAQGLANLARINEVEFAEGGWTGPGSKYQVAGVVHADEYVTPKHIVNSPAARPHITALENMRTGYADGGFVANTNVQASQQSMIIANAMRNMPPIYASWTEGEKVGNRLRFKEGLTRI